MTVAVVVAEVLVQVEVEGDRPRRREVVGRQRRRVRRRVVRRVLVPLLLLLLALPAQEGQRLALDPLLEVLQLIFDFFRVRRDAKSENS